MEFVLLLIGFVCLVKGADAFVDGSSSLAKTFRIPSVIIGLTIVAMGTSAPEASVSLNAALSGNNDIAISNVIGSNIFNTLVVVGICAFMKEFSVDKDLQKRDLPVNILISIVLCLMMANGVMGRLAGTVLLTGIAIYIAAMVYSAMKSRSEGEEVAEMPLWKSILFILAGLAVVVLGGNLVVDNAVKIAEMLGMSQNFIGLTIIALGTSLPELVTSVVATPEGESGLALGNAIGSNLFNIMFILGMSAFITPMKINVRESLVDGLVMVAVALAIWFFSKTKGKLERKEGLICLVSYAAYTGYLFAR